MMLLALLLLNYVVRLDTPTHRSNRSDNLCPLFTSCFSKDREENDPAPWCNPVRQSHRGAAKVEPQLTQLAIELFGVRLRKQRTSLSQQINVKGHVNEISD